MIIRFTPEADTELAEARANTLNDELTSAKTPYLELMKSVATRTTVWLWLTTPGPL
jgi:hypothetical protein